MNGKFNYVRKYNDTRARPCERVIKRLMSRFFLIVITIALCVFTLKSYGQNKCDSVLIGDASMHTYRGNNKLVLIWRKNGLAIYAPEKALVGLKFSFEMSDEDYKKKIKEANRRNKDTEEFEFINGIQRWSWRLLSQSKCRVLLNGKEVPDIRFLTIRTGNCTYYQKLYFTEVLYWDYRPTF